MFVIITCCSILKLELRPDFLVKKVITLFKRQKNYASKNGQLITNDLQMLMKIYNLFLTFSI